MQVRHTISSRIAATRTELLARRDMRIAAAKVQGRDRAGAERLAAALSAAARGRENAEERRLIRRIEALRSELSASSATLEIMDFGARSPNATLTTEEMNQGQTRTVSVGEASNSSSPPAKARLLFHLIRMFRPLQCLEMGTLMGISAAYQATALELNGEGHLYTLEGAEPFAEIAQDNLRRLRLDGRAEVISGRFDQTLTPTIERAGSLHYAFVDGRHDEQATVDYFNELEPRVDGQGLLVFDDIGWSPGMERAWAAIRQDPSVSASATVGVSVGIALIDEQHNA